PLAACMVVRDQTVTGEKDVYVRSVGYRGRRGRIVQLVTLLFAIAGRLLTPQQFARPAVEGEREKLSAVVSGEINAIGGQDRGRLPFRQSRLPEHVLAGRNFAGQSAVFGHTRAVWTAKTRPVAGIRRYGRQKRQKGDQSGMHKGHDNARDAEW